MSTTVILLLLLGGALLIPVFGAGDDNDENDTDGLNEIRGTFGDDQMNGTEGADLMFGWKGMDDINGFGGDDVIKAGEGDDKVDGGEGDDNIEGGPGNDILTGGNGFDRIFGGADNDIINGGPDPDFIAGGDGDDLIFGGFGNSGIDGQPIGTERGLEFIRGDDGNDTIFMWGEGGEARGNAGDDELILVTGDATLEAGAGASDAFYILANVSDEDLTEATIADFDPSRDTLVLTVDHDGSGTVENVAFELSNVVANGVNGVRVDAVFEGDVTTNFEGATAFLPGLTVDSLTNANIEVVLTQNADLTDPQATLAAVKVALQPVS